MKEEIKSLSCYFCEKLTSDFEFFESLQEKDKNALIKDAEKALNKYDEALRKLNAWACKKTNKTEASQKNPWNKGFIEGKFRTVHKRKK